ncbi:DUF3987 domain-containing protein [Chryseobacterium mucoviscidosis]|uniref:Uncharacterized protein n=1 Tax=Chryseobacterium mucoviscidosis TaxID=1945581 RepID=A0A202CI98_9FLAO|nr:DUF3987 domain-containing protein [Chryseobacterium mucoviscidosis]OVE63302.1 hypothetical protein B0E34_00525 [Chryseobacterium mucoviscidosis]
MERQTKTPLIPNKVYKNLPLILRDVTRDFSGREKDMLLTSSLGVLSSLLPHIYGYYDSDIVYPNLQTFITAPIASGNGVIMKARSLVDITNEAIISVSTSDYEFEMKRYSKMVTPCFDLKILPVNINSKDFYSFMARTDGGLLIIESEADIIKFMMDNFSHILKKSFHHEPISFKEEDFYMNIEKPKLSLVLSTTQEQYKSIMNSAGNDLASMFLTYSFDEVTKFKDVFANKDKNKRGVFEYYSEMLEDKYSFSRYGDKLEFELTERQKRIFHQHFQDKQTYILNKESLNFTSNNNRLALIFFKLLNIRNFT